MKTLITAILLTTVACTAAQKTEIKTAEKACLSAARESAKAKLAAGCSNAEQCAIQLTEQEMACAFEALFK